MSVINMDQRRNPRHKINSVVGIENIVSKEKLGMLANLSADGFMMIGPALVSEGNTYQIKLSLSDPIDGHSHIDMAAECLWTNIADSEGKIWSGHRIIDISEEDQKRVEFLIEQLNQ